MRTFRDFIRMSDELYEQAFNRDDIFRVAEGFREQIYYHLLKTLIYDDDYNNEKHLKHHHRLRRLSILSCTCPPLLI